MTWPVSYLIVTSVSVNSAVNEETDYLLQFINHFVVSLFVNRTDERISTPPRFQKVR